MSLLEQESTVFGFMRKQSCGKMNLVVLTSLTQKEMMQQIQINQEVDNITANIIIMAKRRQKKTPKTTKQAYLAFISK